MANVAQGSGMVADGDKPGKLTDFSSLDEKGTECVL
jgi:hypothetical protein